MMGEAIVFLFDALVQPFAAILLLRFHLQWMRAPLRNPLGEFVMALTNFLVLRVRRFIPPTWGLDIASLLLAFMVEMIYLTGVLWVQGFLSLGFPMLGLLALTLVKLLKLSLYLLMIALVAEAVLSWVNPHTPLSGVLGAITRPFLMPLRRRIPPLGNIDFSTLVLLILCQLILIVPMSWLESMALRLH
jgi:YggT family protein